MAMEFLAMLGAGYHCEINPVDGGGISVSVLLLV